MVIRTLGMILLFLSANAQAFDLSDLKEMSKKLEYGAGLNSWSYSTQGTVIDPATGLPVSKTFSFSGSSLYLTATLPIDYKLVGADLLAEVSYDTGMYLSASAIMDWSVARNISSYARLGINLDSSADMLMYGIGADYKVNKKISARMEFLIRPYSFATVNSFLLGATYKL